MTTPQQDPAARFVSSPEMIKYLSDDDFELGGRDLVRLKYEACALVLFYAQNTESLQLGEVWAAAAAEVAGPMFCAVNMQTNRKVAAAFATLRGQAAHPLHWAGLRQYPFVLVYRGGWPVAAYNGPREVQAIADFALTLACDVSYYETKQLGGGMQADNRIGISSYQPYVNPATESFALGAAGDIRGFDPTKGIIEVAAAAPSTAAPSTAVPAATDGAAVASVASGTPTN